MQHLAVRTLEGEVLTPRDLVRVIGRSSPIGARVEIEVEAGLSIAEILSRFARPGFSGPWSVYLGKQPINVDRVLALDPANYARIRVKPGAVVVVMPLLQNGGNVWKSVAGIALVLGAMIVAPYLAPYLVTGFAAVGVTITTATATAIATGAVVLAGTLALNALFPTRPPNNNVESGTLNSIQGAQNQMSPFGAVPVVLGKHRQSPFYAAKPYTEIVGDDQYLRVMFCLGYGPLQIDSLQIGETPLGNYADVNLEVFQGFPTDGQPTIVPGEVDEQQLDVLLEDPFDPPGSNGPTGGTWSDSVVTADNTDEISVDFAAPQGVNAVDPQGDDASFNIAVQMQYRINGSGGAWNGPILATLFKSYKPTRTGINVNVARGQYEVQCRRLTGMGPANLSNQDTVWTALRSIKQLRPITFPKPLALVGLRIRATDQLSGTINTFNCVCTSLVNAYSGADGIWTPNTASQWPADLFRHVLQGPANARPVPDAQIDIVNLQDWWADNVAHGFKFNQVLTDSGSVYDKLCDIASAGRAVPTFIDGKWGVIWDRPADPIVQHFTPRNSWGFKGTRAYAQQPDAWRVSFINEKNGYTQDEIRVYDDGFDETNATLFEGIQFPGVTDPALNYKHGRFQIAQARLRPEKITLNVGWEHLICTRGDRVKVTHDVLLIGLASGRIKSIAGQVVALDETVTIEDGKTYGISVRIADDARSVVRALADTPAGDYNAVTLVGDLSTLSPGDLFGFGETDQESANYRVQAINHQKDLIAALTLVDDAPEISQADQGAIPPYNPNVTVPPDPFTLPPRDLRYLEVIDGQGDTFSALVRLSWQLPSSGLVVSYDVQQQDNNAGGPWVTVASVTVPAVELSLPSAGIWSYRVRCVFQGGTVSGWTSILGVELDGLSEAPDGITNLHERIVDGATMLDWTPVPDKRVIFYEVRKGTSWDSGLVVGSNVAQPPWPTTGDGTYHVRAFVLSPFGTKVYSAADATIEIAGSIQSRNIIVSLDEQQAGWPGALDGGVIDGSFIRTDAGKAISLPWSEQISTELSLAGVHIAVYVSAQIVDIGQPNECRFWTLFEADGIKVGDDFLSVPDVLSSGDILGAASTRFIAAFPIWRFASDGARDVFDPADVFAPTDVFTAGVTWGDWTAIASGARKSRFFQPGLVLITNDETINATATKFSWFVDVPDRTDYYTGLSVDVGGLDVTFYAGGYSVNPTPGVNALPFNGGPNGSLVPHVQRSIINPTNGDEVNVTNLTLAGCTVHVVNAGANVARDGVNILVEGF